MRVSRERSHSLAPVPRDEPARGPAERRAVAARARRAVVRPRRGAPRAAGRALAAHAASRAQELVPASAIGKFFSGTDSQAQIQDFIRPIDRRIVIGFHSGEAIFSSKNMRCECRIYSDYSFCKVLQY